MNYNPLLGLRKAIADGTAEMVKVTYKSFPEAVETTAQAVTAFDDYVLGPTVTFLDTITGQIFSRRWNSYSKDEQNLIKGSAIAAGASVSFVSLYSVATKEIFKSDKARLFEHIENGMNSKDDALNTAVATELIEALVGAGDRNPSLWPDIEAALGPESKDYAITWKNFDYSLPPKTNLTPIMG